MSSKESAEGIAYIAQEKDDITLAMMLLDPLHLSILCGFFGGGDMNGINLLFPEIAVRSGFAVIGMINGVAVWKYLLPEYTKAFQK